MTAFLTTLSQMGRILLYLMMGFGLNRLHILPKGSSTGISRLVTAVFLPALMLYNTVTEFSLSDLGNYGLLILTGGLFWAAAALFSIPTANRLARKTPDDRGVYLYGLCFPNTGAVGTPLVLALLGTAGLFQYNLFLFVSGLMTYAWGVTLFRQGQTQHSFKDSVMKVLNPVFVARVLGLALGALNAKAWMPALTLQVLGDLSACYVPVSLLMTGYAVADYPIGDVFRRPRSYVFTGLRLLILPLLALMAARLLNFSVFMATLVVFAFSGPSGTNVVLFPASYGQDCRTGVSTVLLSSLGSILTVPVMYALMNLLFH